MSLARFLRDARGVASVEFAFVAAPFFALLAATFEVGYLHYENEMLSVAVAEAKRALTTGGVQNNGAVTSAATFVNSYVCPPNRSSGAFRNFDCSQLVVDVRPVANFPSADLSNGFLAGQTEFCPGSANQVLLMRVAYPLPAIFPLNLFDRSVQSVTVGGVTGNYHILLAAAVFQTEDFSGGATLPGC